jgi:uncharacterized membrane protein
MDDADQRLQAIEQRLAAIEERLGLRAAAQFSEPSESGGLKPAATPAATPRKTQNLENLIGAHWLNRIGIAAVLVGAAYFLKYAFENDWIGPATRIVIGVVCGALILIWSERFHARGHLLFSHTLKVVGVGVLYLSIWAAAETYAIIGNGLAFAAMLAVTAALVALAVRHNSEFIAGLAMTSGFLAPVLLSTHTNREVELFTYLAVLDAAALILVAFFPWVRAMAVAFFGTLFLYIGWYRSFYTAAQQPRTIAFASLFFLIFALAPVVRRWIDERASTVLLFLPFASAFVYFMQLSVILRGWHHRLAFYAVVLAALFIVLTLALRWRGDELLAAAHLAIALGFVTIAIPLQFERFSITIGWIAEAAVLLALTQQTAGPARRAFRFLGSMSLALAVFRLLLIDRFHPQTVLLNLRALLFAMTVAVFAGIAIVTRRKGQSSTWRFAVLMLNLIAVIGLSEEVADAFAGKSLARHFAFSALWMLYGAGLMIAGFRRRASFIRWLALALLGVTIAKVFLYDLAALERIYRIVAFIGLGVLLLAISFAYQKKWLTLPEDA